MAPRKYRNKMDKSTRVSGKRVAVASTQPPAGVTLANRQTVNQKIDTDRKYIGRSYAIHERLAREAALPARAGGRGAVLEAPPVQLYQLDFGANTYIDTPWVPDARVATTLTMEFNIGWQTWTEGSVLSIFSASPSVGVANNEPIHGGFNAVGPPPTFQFRLWGQSTNGSPVSTAYSNHIGEWVPLLFSWNGTGIGNGNITLGPPDGGSYPRPDGGGTTSGTFRLGAGASTGGNPIWNIGSQGAASIRNVIVNEGGIDTHSWALNDGPGGIVVDSIGGANGTIIGTESWSPI